MILKAVNGSEAQMPSREEIHDSVFPGKVFVSGRIDRIMFELNRIVKSFLLIKNYFDDENEIQAGLDWNKIQKNRALDNNLEKQYEKLKATLNSKFNDSSKQYLYQYLVAWEEHEWLTQFNTSRGDLKLPEVIENLDIFYFSQRLELLNRFYLQQKLSSLKTPKVIEISTGLCTIPEYYLGKSITLLITDKIQTLLKKEQPELVDFHQLMNLLKVNDNHIPQNTLALFYAYLRNFCSFLIDLGHAEFNEVLHELQKDNLERGYFYYEGKIHPNAVLNITQMALRAGSVDWARSFIETHKEIIYGENETHEFYLMNKALCLFAEGKLNEALDAIPFGSTYSAYHLMARRLELKIYYELHSEILSSKIDAFKMYINRAGNKVFSKHSAELFTNFGNFVHQLSLSIPGDKKRSEQLIRRINEKKLVGERSWLLEKAKEIGEARL